MSDPVGNQNVDFLMTRLTFSVLLRWDYCLKLCRIVIKPVFEVSDQVQLKQGCTAKENGLKSQMKKKRDVTISVEKTKALISCMVTAQINCTFVFAYEWGQYLANTFAWTIMVN